MGLKLLNKEWKQLVRVNLKPRQQRLHSITIEMWLSYRVETRTYSACYTRTTCLYRAILKFFIVSVCDVVNTLRIDLLYLSAYLNGFSTRLTRKDIRPLASWFTCKLQSLDLNGNGPSYRYSSQYIKRLFWSFKRLNSYFYLFSTQLYVSVRFLFFYTFDAFWCNSWTHRTMELEYGVIG